MNSIFEKLLEMGGGMICPQTHNDPGVKGPQPHILSRQQREALERMREENQDFHDSFRTDIGKNQA